MAKTPHVAVLIETSRAYGRGLLEGVARYIREHGPWSVYFKPQGLGEPPPAWLKHWQGDGILARIDDLRLARAVVATKLPAIDLRGRLPDLGLPRVGVDNAGITRLAFQHLRERGYRHFGFCGLRRGEHRHLDERCDDFVRLVEQAGLTCSVFPPARQRGSPPWEQQQQQMAHWLGELPRPVGIMACNDDRGLQLLDACRRARVAVPEQVAVISVDNDTILCNLATPPLTSIDVNPQRVGYEAAGLLDRLMRGTKPPRDGLFFDLGRVVPRQSTDVLALEDAELVKAMQFIRAHACEGILVDDVLGEVCLSRSVLERRFKKALGRTPKAEILSVQIELAKELLTETDLSLDQVAHKSGFQSAKYFSDIFHAKAGIRPAAFRQVRRVR
jgi:LacI family transcriptional regulator